MEQAPGDSRSILLWSYNPDAPSFRHRIGSLAPDLEARGWRPRVDRIPRGRYVVRILERYRQLRSARLVVLAKIKTSPTEGWLLRRLARRIVFDFDDAIYLRRPRTYGGPPDRSWFRRHKFARVCRTADLVVACNETLAAEARRWGHRVEVIPTAVDSTLYPVPAPETRSGHTLVWIGMPENIAYLEQVRPVLGRLVADCPDLRLRVISSRFPSWPELPLECVQWSPQSEVEELVTADVGLMPLTDDDWSRGKCAFKLLQYMAAALPCVASDVGVNGEVVVDGQTGYLARSEDDWLSALRALLESEEKRQAFGAAGRLRVERTYDRRVISPRMVDLLETTAMVGPDSGARV